VPAGRLLCIMGGSGSGKTTLLNCISGRSEDNIQINGSVLYNGKPLNKKMIGYVMQQDFLLPNLTVRETLEYAAFLRLPSSFSRERKLEIVILYTW
jgi:ABC-type multidrug transport system ATPase subunit